MSASMRCRINASRSDDMPTASGLARGSASAALALNGQHSAHVATIAAGIFFMGRLPAVFVVAASIAAFGQSRQPPAPLADNAEIRYGARQQCQEDAEERRCTPWPE